MVLAVSSTRTVVVAEGKAQARVAKSAEAEGPSPRPDSGPAICRGQS